MIAAVSCLLIALACQDAERVTAPLRAPEASHAIAGPPVMLSLTCTLLRNSSTISCAPAMPARATGVSANVILAATGTYAQFVPFNLVKDTVKQIWSFDGFIHNLMQQSIGTVNGTTVTGSKIFVTDIYATQGSGSVSIINADGRGNFTAPNQPYFTYNQILAPAANSNAKLWKVSVPNTVTAVNMDILMSTDFPAEQNVTLLPPDSTPAWVLADSNLAGPTDVIGGPFAKNVLRLYFQAEASLADRQLAVGYVGGTVVGGVRYVDSTGYYILRVADDGSGSALIATVRRLDSLPQVDHTTMYLGLSHLYLRPNDGGDWAKSKWRLNPDSADISQQRWPLEVLNAPMAWGCSSGDPSTMVGIVDHGFRNPPDLVGNLPDTSYALNPPDTGTHATEVSAVLAAAGNNNIGITGMMWRASLQIEDPRFQAGSSTPSDTLETSERVASLAMKLAARGVRVVNISLGVLYQTKSHVYRAPTGANDSVRAALAAREFLDGLHAARHNKNTSPMPLLVIAAGDFGQTGNNANTDAWWSGLPILRDSLGDSVIVVGATSPHGETASFSGVNTSGSSYFNHHYVTVVAPGDSIYTLDRNGNPKQESGTSVAAPYITGIAGLLLSFDPRLTADTLRRLILNGASNGNRPVTEPGGAVFLANAYESLKLAAQRQGAPLCGNRAWSVGDTVYVQRDSTTTEAIFTTSEGAGELDVMHGGHRIHFFGEANSDDRDFLLNGAQWQEDTKPDTLPTPMPSGAWRSLFQLSHDGDSAVLVQTNSGTIAAAIPVTLEQIAGGGTKQIATLSVAIANTAVLGCVYTTQGPNDSTATCQQSDVVSGSSEDAFAVTPAYSPRGDQVIVTINRHVTNVTGVGGWHQCLFHQLNNGLAELCRAVQYERSAEDAFVYAVNTRTGSVTRLADIPSTELFWQEVGEPGTEMVLGGGLDSTAFSVQDDTITEHLVGGLQTLASCRIEYRTLTTGTVTRSIPSNDACAVGGDGLGTISPDRLAQTHASSIERSSRGTLGRDALRVQRSLLRARSVGGQP